MFSHAVLGTNDLARSKKFYNAIFTAVGGPAPIDTNPGMLIYAHKGAMLVIKSPLNGLPATYANGGTIGYALNPEEALAWHKAGVENGGINCEDPPGYREGTPYHLAYLRDPDGNKLCAFHIKS